METYVCPVCGYDKLDEPPTNHNICSCCGTHFEYDDFETSHEDLRKQWINGGCQWFSDYTKQPENWNPQKQIENLIQNNNPKTTTI
jgi:hypothetical protein